MKCVTITRRVGSGQALGGIQSLVKTRLLAASPRGGDRRRMCKALATSTDGDIPGLIKDVWRQDQQHVQFPSLDRDVQTDVCIVGAGIAGITLAYELVRAGRKVVLLEGRVRGAGMTGKTTAHIMQWNDDYYSEVEKTHGLQRARLVADSHVKAIDRIKDIVAAEDIDCDFKVVNGYLFPHNASDGISTLDEELAACHRVGLGDVEKIKLSGSASVGRISTCLRFPYCADFHPLRYINHMANRFSALGGQIFELSQVKSAHNDRVQTFDGYSVRAQDAVVLATHSPITRNLAVHSRQEAYRSYVVALLIPKGSVERAQYWDTAEPYHYVRTQEYDDKNDVLIVGGEDHQTGLRPDKFYPAYDRLTNWARQHWPMATDVVYKWTGQVYEPVDLLGLYGPDPLNPATPKHYIITGHSGQGMTGGTIGAMVVADQILGRNNPWEDVYCPSRLESLPTKTAVEGLAQEAAAVARGFADNIVPKSVKDFEGAVAPGMVEGKLEVGCGMVVQEGVFGPNRVALFKDEQGIVHRRSAICPHLLCCVEWNPADKTFDCPCHGSQFDRYGRVIAGPAEHDLHKL